LPDDTVKAVVAVPSLRVTQSPERTVATAAQHRHAAISWVLVQDPPDPVVHEVWPVAEGRAVSEAFQQVERAASG
jgi:hypothetical protein